METNKPNQTHHHYQHFKKLEILLIKVLTTYFLHMYIDLKSGGFLLSDSWAFSLY